MANIKVVQHNPHKSRYGPRLPEHEWEEIRPFMERLHADGESLKEIIRRAEVERGFLGTYSAMYTRFTAWGLTTPRSVLQTASDDAVPNVSRQISTNEDEASLPVAGDDSATGTTADDDMYSSCFDNKGSTDEDETSFTSDNESQLDGHQDTTIPAGSASQPTYVAPTIVEYGADNHGADVVLQHLEAHLSKLAHSDENSDTLIPKRPRSLVSSMRSSWSGDTRSFMQQAKRLRYLSSVNSLTPSLKRLSVGSSRKSLSFELVTGYGPDLDTVVEMPADESDKSMTPKNSPKARRRLLRFSSPTKSSLPEEPASDWDNVFEEQCVRSYELSSVDIEYINDHLSTLSLGITHGWRLRSNVKSLPAVDAQTLFVLRSRCPLSQCVAIAHHPDPGRRYLIVGQDQINDPSGEVPFLRDHVLHQRQHRAVVTIEWF